MPASKNGKAPTAPHPDAEFWQSISRDPVYRARNSAANKRLGKLLSQMNELYGDLADFVDNVTMPAGMQAVFLRDGLWLHREFEALMVLLRFVHGSVDSQRFRATGEPGPLDKLA